MARINKTIMTDGERFRWLERVTEEFDSVEVFGGLAGYYEVNVIRDEMAVAVGSGATIQSAIDICAEALEEKLG